MPSDLNLRLCSKYYTIQVDYALRDEVFLEKRSKDKTRGECRGVRGYLFTSVLSLSGSNILLRLEDLLRKIVNDEYEWRVPSKVCYKRPTEL